MVLGLLVSASACTTTGDISNPVMRKLTWYSFLDGDDIRATCRASADDRLRLVYNGRYNDQVRVYELVRRGGGAMVETRVLGPVQVNRAFSLGGLGSMLGGAVDAAPLGTAHAEALWRAVEESGAFAPAPMGLRLDSDDLWWTVVGCRAGHAFFHAWEVSEPADQPAFAALLSDLDGTGVAWPSYRDVVVGVEAPGERAERPYFLLEVGRSGRVR